MTHALIWLSLLLELLSLLLLDQRLMFLHSKLHLKLHSNSLTKLVLLQLTLLQTLRRVLMLLWQTFKVNLLLLSQLQKAAKLLNTF